MPVKYHYCNQCKHEFYTDEAWAGHVCVGGTKIDDNKRKAQEAIAKIGGVEALKSLPYESQEAIIRDLGTEGIKIAQELGIAKENKDGNANAAPTDGEQSTPPAEAISARLAAADELVRMKQELVAAGHEVQTFSAEETKAEYEKMKAEQEAKAADTPAAKPAKKKTTKKVE